MTDHRSYDPGDTIPAEPPWQPTLVPRRPPPPHGSDYAQGTIVGSRSKIDVSQFWLRIVGGIIPCGEAREIEDKYTVGLKRTETAEISATLEATAEPFKSTIGSKLQETLEASHARELTFKSTEKAPPCEELVYVTWQLVERFVVTRKRFLLGWSAPESIYRPSEFTSPDRLSYPTDRCCSDVRKQIADGLNELFVVKSRGLSRIMLGRTLDDGRVELAGVAGLHQLNKTVSPAEAFQSVLAGSEIGVLREYRGSLDFLSDDPDLLRRLRWSRPSRQRSSSATATLAVLAGVTLAGLSALFLQRSRRQSPEQIDMTIRARDKSFVDPRPVSAMKSLSISTSSESRNSAESSS
jgi:hypothetical protein